MAATSTVVNAYAAVTANAAAAQAVLTVGSAAGFAAGDLVLVWQVSGATATSGDQSSVSLSASPVGEVELGRVALDDARARSR